MAEGKGRGARTAQPSRRLVAIMFTDLVGYSAMAHRDEALAIELLELHRAWVREILPRYGGGEIETVGDAFLIEFAGALAAVECAIAIQRRFAEHNAAAPEHRRMELRVGIHLGDVEHKGEKVFGDGVNIASRIHGMAKPGGICVSEDVQHAVRNRPAFQFTSLGTPPLKNIAGPLELFELASSMSLAPPAAVSVAKLPRRPPRWLPAAAVGALVIGIGAAAATWYARRPATRAIPAIAVLPFENLSADPESAFFTDGLHDSVIGHLSRVAGLKVISRTSVMGYRGRGSTLRQIAGELGVGHVVEGSVQRAGSKLRVVAQLIDTATDTHLWSSEYDRDLADVFAVQADIARQVAGAVHAKLTPQEQASLQAVPTKNPAAYDLYLRAMLFKRSASFNVDKARGAIGLLDQAIALDPQFAHAYALRSQLHDGYHWFGYDPSGEHRQLAGTDAEKALALAPELADSHVARAMHLYHGSRNYEAAIGELETARRLAPGDAEVHFWLGVVYRRQGRWDDAVATLERAAALDPLSAQVLNDQVGTLAMLRRFAEARPGFQRLAELQPDDPTLPAWAANNEFEMTGDLGAWAKAVAAIPAEYDPGCDASSWRWSIAYYQRRFDDAVAAMAACKEPYITSSGGEQLPKDFLAARAQWHGSKRTGARLAPQLKAELERILARNPGLPATRLAFAYTLVMLGQNPQALAEVDRALAALPVSRDAVLGAQLLPLAADIRANAGAIDLALDTLDQAFKVPAGAYVQDVRFDPGFDPLRKDPRFDKMLDQYRPGKV